MRLVNMVARIDLKGIVVIVGNYGSGKTEVAVNLALDQHARGTQVRVADLDLVNPYFRTREVRHLMARLGIEMVLPPEGWLQADLPILTPQVSGLIRKPGGLAILDVGGDGAGATVLAALADAFQSSGPSLQMFQVVNPFRPNTQTVERCLAMRAAIEAAAHMRITGWIGNAHLLDETTIDHIQEGYELMRALSKASELPLICITAGEALIPETRKMALACPVLTIHRQLVPPWLKPTTF
jgi:RecA/RadA recombinase